MSNVSIEEFGTIINVKYVVYLKMFNAFICVVSGYTN